LQEVGFMILFRSCIWQHLYKSVHDKGYAKDSSTQKFYIINVVSIFYLIEIDLLFYTKILHV
jgi:hypothetical protein